MVAGASGLVAAVHAMVSRVPAGRVVTYGQIARCLGRPRAARQVGRALAGLPADSAVPWHRVVNARGGISPRREGGSDEFQRLLLEDEGVQFDGRGRIDLERFGWTGW
jgi:methylated-DNA-protein-cysteine methyltransferase-like protein